MIRVVMGAQKPFFLEYLKEEFDLRMAKNTQYSLRAFARWLNIDASFLSKVFSRQKVLSLDAADKVISKLAPQDVKVREKFLKSVSEELACAALKNFESNLTSCQGDS